jgi:hypothetical protein
MAFHRPAVTLDAAGGGVSTSSGLASSPLLAVGSYDGNTRLLSTHSWNVAFVFPAAHPSDMMPSMANEVITTVEVLESDESNLTKAFDDSASLNDTIGSSYSTK